ncbi:MAG: glycosyltransferase [Acidobacteriota bacterium]
MNHQTGISVCFISHSARMRGAERSLLEAVTALTHQGIRCCVAIPRHGPLAVELEKRGIVWNVIPYTWWMGSHAPFRKRAAKLFINLAAVLLLILQIRRWGCNLIYTNSLTVCVGAVAARLLQLPHVWHIHEFGYEHHGLTFDLGDSFSLRLVDRSSTACVMASHALAAKYQPHLPSPRVSVIYQSVSTPLQVNDSTRPDTKSLRCVIVGALQEGKGQEEAIRAFTRLASEGLDIELWIVGGGEKEEVQRLRALVDTSGFGKRIFFTGEVENVFPYLKASDVVLVCSRFEAFGRTTVEGMLLGKPVVGTRSGAAAELIQEGVTGHLYEPGDDRELAEKIRYFHSYPEEARAMGAVGRRWAAHRFTPERYGRDLSTLLRSVLTEYSGSV